MWFNLLKAELSLETNWRGPWRDPKSITLVAMVWVYLSSAFLVPTSVMLFLSLALIYPRFTRRPSPFLSRVSSPFLPRRWQCKSSDPLRLADPKKRDWGEGGGNRRRRGCTKIKSIFSVWWRIVWLLVFYFLSEDGKKRRRGKRLITSFRAPTQLFVLANIRAKYHMTIRKKKKKEEEEN